MPPRVFARCASCGHAAVVRSGASCGHCHDAMLDEEAPADLFGAWRCACDGCVRTPC